MEEPNMASLLIPLDDFLVLPIIVKRRILSFLSPIDLLNLAECHQELLSLVVRQPKKAFSIDNSDFYLDVKGWNGDTNGQMLIFWSEEDHYEYAAVRNVLFGFLCRSYTRVVLTAGKPTEEGKRRKMEILMRNCTIESVRTTAEMVDWGIRAKSIEASGRTAQEIVAQIEATKATELRLGCHWDEETMKFQRPRRRDGGSRCDVFDSEAEMSKMLGYSVVQELSRIELFGVPASLLLHMDKIRIPNITVNLVVQRIDFEDYIEALVPFLRQIIEEWVMGIRDIETFKIDHCTGKNVLQWFWTSKNYQQLEDLLTSEFEGNFADKNIDRRNLRLIRRNKDESGLIVWIGRFEIRLLSCNYELRRARGVGCDSTMSEILDKIDNQLQRPARRPDPRLQRHADGGIIIEDVVELPYDPILLSSIDRWREYTSHLPEGELDWEVQYANEVR